MKESKRKAHRRKDKTSPPTPGAAEARDRLEVIRRVEWACALALTALIVFLHLYRITKAGGLWRDEANTLATATMPSYSQMWSSMIYARPPILPYVVIRIWTEIVPLANIDTGLRVLGGLTGIGILATLWWSGRLLRLQVPLLALALFGLNPNVIQWGDSPRGYGFGALVILALYGLIWKVVESPTPLWIALATLFAAASVHSVFHNVPLVFAICVAGFLVCWRKRLRRRGLLVLGIGAVAALSILPYWSLIRSYQAMNTLTLVSTTFPDVLQRSRDSFGAGVNFLLGAWFVLGAMAILAAGYRIARKPEIADSNQRFDRTLFSLALLIVGTVAYLWFLKEAQLTVFAWHCIPWMGVAAVSIDALIGLHATAVPTRVMRLLATLAVAGASIPAAWMQASTRQTNVDLIASRLREQASAGDFIIVNPWFCGTTFQYYYRGAAPWTTLPPISELRFIRFDLLQQQIANENPLQAVFDGIQASLSQGHRVWVVGGIDFPPEGQLPPPLPRVPSGSWENFVDEYQRTLTLQLGHFLRSHVSGANDVDLNITLPLNPYEKLYLVAFQGWQP